jgi:hypothetical protein
VATPPKVIDNQVVQRFANEMASDPALSLAVIGKRLGLDETSTKQYGWMAKGWILAQHYLAVPDTEVMKLALAADIRAGIHKASVIETLFELIKPELPLLDATRIPDAPLIHSGAELDCLLTISDMHGGKLVRWDDTGGMGGYDIEILKRRVAKYMAHVIRLLEIEGPNIKRLWLALQGDLVDGTNIFKGQRNHLDPTCRGVVEQTMLVGGLLSEMLLQLAAVVPVIIVSSANGNHARIGEKGEAHWTDNFDYFLYMLLAERLAHVPNIHFQKPTGNFIFWSINGHNFYFEHGENIRSWGGIPFYGLSRASSEIQRLVGAFVHHFCVGHFHNKAEFGNVLMNNNWVGSDDFSIYALKKGGCPSQQYFEIHPHYGISSSRTIYLEDRRAWGLIQPTDADTIIAKHGKVA